MTVDPRDSIEPGVKEWEEFRSGFAAAFLLVWITEEAAEDLSTYAADLQNRFMSGWDIQDQLEADPDLPEEMQDFPLPPVGGVESPDYPSEITWMDEGEARLLYDQLFPHDDSSGELSRTSAGLAVVALHGSLDTYVRSLGVYSHGYMPTAVRTFLKALAGDDPLSSETMDVLAECDATRNVVVHNRGVVDERYIRHVRASALQEGEFRHISAADLHRFARAIWKTAATVHRLVPGGKPDRED